MTFPNTGKRLELIRILTEANRVVNVFIQALWKLGSAPRLKFYQQKTETLLSARLQQVCSAKALQIIKSVRKRKVKTCPVYKALSLDLDSRFVEFLKAENSFDFWTKLGSTGSPTVRIPCKKHRHFNQFRADGWALKSSVKLRLKNNQLILDVYFEKPMSAKKTAGKIIGVDIGYNKLLATSEGQVIGTGFKEQAEKIQRKKQGSKAFKRALVERDELVNKAIKELPWAKTRALVVEDLKGLKQGRRFCKQFQARFQRWTYPAILKRLELTAEISGVHVQRINPAFTSQTCSRCGVQDKKSRSGEVFTCTACGWVGDADLNTSVNISRMFRLPEDMDPVQKVGFSL